MARIIRSAEAEMDAVEIWAHIAKDNPPAADRLLNTFDEIFILLSEQQHLGQSADALASALRFFPTGNYLVFYRPMNNGVQIARILHCARNITEEFFIES